MTTKSEPQPAPPEPDSPGPETAEPQAPRPKRRVLAMLRDTLIITAAASAVGLISNAVRSEAKIAWVQQEPYDILVPCPEPVGDPTEISPDDPLLLDERSHVIDARSEAEFKEWHIPESTNQEFDWLGPPIDKEVAIVAKQVAKTGAHRVLIYGDGDDPDSGREWAKLLSGARIKNVFYVKGGAPALQARKKKGNAP